MSEFICYQGHEMGSDRFCPKCGSPVWTLDGKTNNQLRKEERDEWEQEREDEKAGIR